MSTVGSAALAKDRNEPMEWTASDASMTGTVLQKLQPGDDRGNSTFSSDEELRCVSKMGSVTPSNMDLCPGLEFLSTEVDAFSADHYHISFR